MKTYPIMLDLQGRKVVVIGGGEVGVRKARSLAAAGADVRLVTKAVADDADTDGLDVSIEPYRAEHVDGCVLVFACTDDADLNARIAVDARAAGAWVNCADQPEDCDFFAAATVTDGDVVVAVGTGGSAPHLAGRLKDTVRAALPERIGEFAAAVAALRDEIKTQIADIDRRGEIVRRLTSAEGYSVFLTGGESALRAVMQQELQS